MRSTHEILVRLLGNIGSRREVEYYLQRFSKAEGQKFAVIKVSGGVIARQLDDLASSLTMLHELGLAPIVVHGVEPQLGEALIKEGLEPQRLEGRPIVSPAALKVARAVAREINLQLTERLEQLGTQARPISSGVFEAEPLDTPVFGLVGRIVRIEEELLNASIRGAKMPIVASFGETRTGQILYLTAASAARALAKAIQPLKVIVLNEEGGIRGQDGEVISAINMPDDYDELLRQPWLPESSRWRLRDLKELLGELSPAASVSITSPDHLAKELFTYEGNGTLVRHAERVTCFEGQASIASLDFTRLKALLEES